MGKITLRTKLLLYVMVAVLVPLLFVGGVSIYKSSASSEAQALAQSTLLRDLNGGSYTLAASQFPRWDNVAGKPSPGLLRRREAERELFVQA